MPSWELFDEQDQAYQDSILPPAVTARVSVEEASPVGWHRYVGSAGIVLGMKIFGMSAPLKVVTEHFGFVPEHVVVAAKEVLARAGK
jgi:transketolase